MISAEEKKQLKKAPFAKEHLACISTAISLNALHENKENKQSSDGASSSVSEDSILNIGKDLERRVSVIDAQLAALISEAQELRHVTQPGVGKKKPSKLKKPPVKNTPLELTSSLQEDTQYVESMQAMTTEKRAVGVSVDSSPWINNLLAQCRNDDVNDITGRLNAHSISSASSNSYKHIPNSLGKGNNCRVLTMEQLLLNERVQLMNMHTDSQTKCDASKFLRFIKPFNFLDAKENHFATSQSMEPSLIPDAPQSSPVVESLPSSLMKPEAELHESTKHPDTSQSPQLSIRQLPALTDCQDRLEAARIQRARKKALISNSGTKKKSTPRSRQINFPSVKTMQEFYLSTSLCHLFDL